MRVVTWNIRGGLGIDGVRSTRRIMEVLREIDADVVCLQEVHRWLPGGAFEDQPRALADGLSMQVLFCSAMRFGLGFGNAILCRSGLDELEISELPNPGERRRPGLWFERRVLMRAIGKPSGLPVWIFNTHWSLNASDRKGAAFSALGAIAAVNGPLVLCGDLNAAPDSDEIRTLLASGLVDSCCGRQIRTFPSNEPIRRIDYVFARGVQASETRVASTQASDHLPVVVDICELPRE